MTERGVNKALRNFDQDYRELCVGERVFSDTRSLSAANFLSLGNDVLVDPESSDEQCVRLADLAEEYGADPDIIQSVLERHEPSLACTEQFIMTREG